MLAAGSTTVDDFTYTVTDNHGQSTTGVVDVTVSVNDAGPTTSLLATATDEDTSIAGSLAPSVSFADAGEPGGSISFTPETVTTTDGAIVTVGANGAYSYNPNGSTVFETLAAGSTTVDDFTYTVTDNHGQSTTGVVDVTVSVNDAGPTTSLLATATDEDTSIAGSLGPSVRFADAGGPGGSISFT